MFTGIILAVGALSRIESKDGACRLAMDAGELPLAGVELGDSITAGGACSTARRTRRPCRSRASESTSCRILLTWVRDKRRRPVPP